MPLSHMLAPLEEAQSKRRQLDLSSNKRKGDVEAEASPTPASNPCTGKGDLPVTEQSDFQVLFSSPLSLWS